MTFQAFGISGFLTLNANFEAFIESSNAIARQQLFGESVTFRFNVDAVGTTDNIEIEVLTGHRTSDGNGLAGGTAANDIELNASDGFTTDDDMNGTYLVMTSGGEQGQMRLITDSAQTDNGVTLDHNLSGTPSAAETYALYRMTALKFIIDMSAAISESNPHNAGVKIDWQDAEFVIVRARATGATDTHRIQMSYQEDGGPA